MEFPVLEINPLPASPRLRSLLTGLDRGDWAVFISANAVVHGLDLVDETGADLSGLRVASLGGATSRALEARGVPVDLECPAPVGSETLLSTAEMQAVENKTIFIFKGQGGRDLLENVLGGRGAHVESVECYVRGRPRADRRVLRAAEAEGPIDAAIASSVDALGNLVLMIREVGCDHLLRTTLVVAGERQRAHAEHSGWAGPIVAAKDASDDAFLHSLGQLRRS